MGRWFATSLALHGIVLGAFLWIAARPEPQPTFGFSVSLSAAMLPEAPLERDVPLPEPLPELFLPEEEPATDVEVPPEPLAELPPLEVPEAEPVERVPTPPDLRARTRPRVSAPTPPLDPPPTISTPVSTAPAARVDRAVPYGTNLPPIYPAEAVRRAWVGVVSLRLRIDPTGDVGAAWVVRSSGYPVLDQAALDAALRWRFVPERQGGVAVESFRDQDVRFAPSL